MKPFNFLALILFLSGASIFAFDQQPEFLQRLRKTDPWLERSYTHVAPNERSPGWLKPVLNGATPGALISVGTERGFMTAGLSDKITFLVLVDVDPYVVLFNTMNTVLLKLSKNIQDYRRLRLEASSEEWQRMAKLNQTLTEYEKRFLIEEKFWSWWVKQVRQLYTEYTMGFDPLHKPYLYNDNDGLFKDANYLYLKKNYQRLKNLADQGKIKIQQTDLNSSDFQNLVSDLANKMTISALDISNAWQDGYLEHNTIDFLNSLSLKLPDSTLLIITRSERGGRAWTWGYYVYRFDSIKSFGGASTYIRMKQRIADVIILDQPGHSPYISIQTLSCAGLLNVDGL